MTVLDAGCGVGRNLQFLLREGYEVYGLDANPEAIRSAPSLAPQLPASNFRVEPWSRAAFRIKRPTS
jgi:tellurite methyltransferase